MKNKKVVINGYFGGFGLSPEAVMKYAELSGFKVYGYVDDRDESRNRNGTVKRVDLSERNFVIYWLKDDLGETATNDKLNAATWFHERDIPRHDPVLVKVVETLKDKANGHCASLRVVEIPEDVDYEIDEYDGSESIHEKHRSWS